MILSTSNLLSSSAEQKRKKRDCKNKFLARRVDQHCTNKNEKKNLFCSFDVLAYVCLRLYEIQTNKWFKIKRKNTLKPHKYINAYIWKAITTTDRIRNHLAAASASAAFFLIHEQTIKLNLYPCLLRPTTIRHSKISFWQSRKKKNKQNQEKIKSMNKRRRQGETKNYWINKSWLCCYGNVKEHFMPFAYKLLAQI